MHVPEEIRHQAGHIFVISLGGGLLGLHVIHGVSPEETISGLMYGVLVPAIFATGIILSGVWLRVSQLDGADVFRISLWCFLGGSILALGSIRTILYQQSEGIQVADVSFLIAGQASLGGLVGFVLGIYAVRTKNMGALAERLDDHLTVINRVLRHDIRNEASVISGRAQLLTDETDHPEQVETIQEHANNLVDLSRQAQIIDRIARDGEPNRVEVDLVPVLEEQINWVEQNHPEVEIERSFIDSARVVANPLIESAIGNVIDNAIEHNDADTPRITIECSRLNGIGEDGIEVRIADNGPGIPEDEIEILERGYETKLQHMRGLGLWLVNWIVQASDGDVRFQDDEGTGSVIAIRLERA